MEVEIRDVSGTARYAGVVVRRAVILGIGTGRNAGAMDDD
jgi:hypothetical protein